MKKNVLYSISSFNQLSFEYFSFLHIYLPSSPKSQSTIFEFHSLGVTYVKPTRLLKSIPAEQHLSSRCQYVFVGVLDRLVDP